MMGVRALPWLSKRRGLIIKFMLGYLEFENTFKQLHFIFSSRRKSECGLPRVPFPPSLPLIAVEGGSTDTWIQKENTLPWNRAKVSKSENRYAKPL